MFYPLNAPDGTEIYPIAPGGYESRWMCGSEKFGELETNNLIEWVKVKKNGKEIWQVYQKFYLEGRLKQPSNLWKDVEGNKKATRDLKVLFDGKKIFDFPKPIGLIQKMIQLNSSDTNSIILDFFAGSGTTAHAVMRQNSEDHGNRKFICVQLPEKIKEDSEARRVGYKTIADICKERIRRAAKKIKEESRQQKLTGTKQDLGFKVFKLAKSNYRIWEDYDGKDADELKKQAELFSKPLVDGYDDTDVIYEVIVKEGYGLNSRIEKVDVSTNMVYRVTDDNSSFFITLDAKIDAKTLDGLDLSKDTTLVCIDDSLDDSQKNNISMRCNLKTI